MTPARVQVHSSLLAAVTYTDDASLVVEFRRGSVYRYFTVPRTVFEALINADSVGSYFNNSIRGRFPFRQVM